MPKSNYQTTTCVVTRKSNYKFNELRAESVFNGRLSQLAAILLDVDNQKMWAYGTVNSKLLKKNSETDLIYHIEIASPWPYPNRDVVLHLGLEQNPKTKAITVNTDYVEGFLPPQKGLVRLKYSDTTWEIMPINAQQSKINLRIQIDAGDDVPGWIVNLLSHNAPYESFLKLKEKMYDIKYANTPPGIVEDYINKQGK